MRSNGFEAVEPLLSVYARRGARVLGQMLVTVRVERAGGMRPLLEDGHRDPVRGPALDALATSAAHLHATGFWHGDAKAQNILVDDQDRVHFIDLDGAGFSGVSRRRARQQARDLKRFKRNWIQFQEKPPVR